MGWYGSGSGLGRSTGPHGPVLGGENQTTFGLDQDKARIGYGFGSGPWPRVSPERIGPEQIGPDRFFQNYSLY
jgi:hypothetical protein